MINKSENEIIRLSISDFFTSDILKIAILPFIVTIIFVYTIFFSAVSIGLGELDNVSIEATTSLSANSNVNDTVMDNIVNYILTTSIAIWVINFMVYTIGSFMMLYVSVFISIIVIGFLTPYILSKIRKKHFPHLEIQGDVSFISPLGALIKYALIMILLFIVFIPLYFIPIVNIIAFNLPIYYFFHKMLNFDVATTILKKEDLSIFKNKNEKKLRLRTLLLFLLSMIPFMSLILPVFYIVYIGHGYFATIDMQKQMRYQ